MSITLAQFRASLGKLADGLSDEEIQKRLDFAYRFSESFYDWFRERKSTGIEALTGGYISDVVTDTARNIQRIKAINKNIYLFPQPAAELIKVAKQHEKRYPHK